MSPMHPIRWLPALLALAVPLILAAAPPNTDPKPDRPSLEGQLLIAAPEMADPRFQQTVLVMMRHSATGAMAVAINRPIGEQPLAKLLEALGEAHEGVTGTVPIYLGGPVEVEIGVVLHSADYHQPGTLAIGSSLGVTMTKDIFRDIAKKTGPKRYLIAFGYAGWGAGQLEGEIAQNAWFTAPLDLKLIFEEDRDRVWEIAMQHRTRDL